MARTYWTDGFNEYETEEEARDHAMCEVEWSDIEEYFKENVSYHDLFEWTRTQLPDEFFCKFEDAFIGADEEYFNNNYWEDKDEDEEEDD